MSNHRTLLRASISLSALLLAPLLSIACNPDIISIGGIDAAGPAGGDSSVGPSSGAAGGESPVDPSCVPAQSSNPVDDACGIFVRLAGDDLNAGTKAAPVATLARAVELAAAAQKRIYACAEVFPEALVVPEGIEIYGGLDCAAGFSVPSPAQKTVMAPAPGQIPLTFIAGGSGVVHLEDVEAKAADAVTPGGSSIAAAADAVTLELVRCNLIAGHAMAGEVGAAPGAQASQDPDDPEVRGGDGHIACMGGGSGNPGAFQKTNAVCASSIGGNGGIGRETEGLKGDDGMPVPAPNPNMFGIGGAGGQASGCQAGSSGAPGMDGPAGQGGSSLGTISLAGYQGVASGDGGSGQPGQGGGGGGGAKGKIECHGASGGSGGAGGCGGQGGNGGGPGGSSIAFLNLGASSSLVDVTLTAKNGGDGGSGGLGQDGAVGGNGGKGGSGGFGTLSACDGGAGGPGGSGGRGGGGRGGHSVGIAFVGAAPALDGVTILLGSAGLGGESSDPSGAGASGEATVTLAF